MTKTKNFPHRKKARRETARRILDARLQYLDREVEKAKKAKDEVRLADVERRLESAKKESAQLEVNLKSGYTAKQRRKQAKRKGRLQAAA